MIICFIKDFAAFNQFIQIRNKSSMYQMLTKLLKLCGNYLQVIMSVNTFGLHIQSIVLEKAFTKKLKLKAGANCFPNI